MAEQMGTPGSNADLSVNGGKTGAPKDKACPFCHQQFTSSSLGRHLDLYIKEKNPKPADGIHNVDEIRKMRGGITRRQPRNSMSRREGSTPSGTPGAIGKPSPRSDVDMSGNRSPSLRRDGTEVTDGVNYPGKSRYYVNSGSFEATGVINNIPTNSTRNGDSMPSWDGEENATRRPAGRSRTVSKQMLAKTTFEQKQKMMEALDTAKASELALRELFGSLRAAKQRVEATSIFNYDPLTLDFPALTLHCLPPPPTLHTSSPLPTSSSWSILPPSERQYEALRSHFATEFHRWRISCAIATTTQQDDLSYPPPQADFFTTLTDPVELTRRAEAQAAELEVKLNDHLHTMFAHWQSLSPSKRTELWNLELARSVGRKSEEIQKMKTASELQLQENAHLKLQVDELSRLQQPREFRLSPPGTYPVDRQMVADLGEAGMKWSGVGFKLMDRNLDLDAVIRGAIDRWKSVVRQARIGGLATQRLLTGDSVPQSQGQCETPANDSGKLQHTTNGGSTGSDQDADGDADADADADADMEEDASFMDMTDTPVSGGRAPEAPMASTGTTFRLTNGNNGMDQSHKGGSIRTDCVAGYVRVG